MMVLHCLLQQFSDNNYGGREGGRERRALGQKKKKKNGGESRERGHVCFLFLLFVCFCSSKCFFLVLL